MIDATKQMDTIITDVIEVKVYGVEVGTEPDLVSVRLDRRSGNRSSMARLLQLLQGGREPVEPIIEALAF